jgi:DNA-binding transcriptional LysR family regulator
VNLRQLEFFIALARERHFGRAAAACHVSQPAMSMAIRRLEDELGVRLVERGPGATDLTEEGRALVDRARAVVASTDGIVTEASRLRGQLTATLRLGTVPTAVAAIPTISRTLLREHPGVRLEVRTLSATQIVTGIARRELDAGISYADDPPSGLNRTTIYREHLLLVQADDAHPGPAGPVDWAEVAGLPLCLLTRDTHHRQIIDRAFTEAGVSARPRVEADSFGVLLGLVGAGWPTIIGHPWLGDLEPRRIQSRRLVAPQIAPAIGLLTPASEPASPVVRVLREVCAREEIQEHLAPPADTPG